MVSQGQLAGVPPGDVLPEDDGSGRAAWSGAGVKGKGKLLTPGGAVTSPTPLH